MEYIVYFENLKILKINQDFSSPELKKLESHHSILTSKTLNKLKNQQLSLDPSKKLG